MNELQDGSVVEKAQQIQYIIIKLGEEQFGIDIMYIDNIVRMQQITRLPKVEHYLKGVINIRGEIVPVMSIRDRMGMSEDEITKKSRIIILKFNGELFGIIVDEVNQVMTISSDNIEKVEYSSKEEIAAGRFISGVGKYDGGLVSILDLAFLEPDNKDRKD